MNKIDFYYKHLKELQKDYWRAEMDIRYLERQKIKSSKQDLGDIEKSLNMLKGKKQYLYDKMEFVGELLGEERSKKKEDDKNN